MSLGRILSLFDPAGDPGAPDYFFDQNEYNTALANRNTYLGDVKSDRGRLRTDRDYWRGQERNLMGLAGSRIGLGERAIDSSG